MVNSRITKSREKLIPIYALLFTIIALLLSIITKPEIFSYTFLSILSLICIVLLCAYIGVANKWKLMRKTQSDLKTTNIISEKYKGLAFDNMLISEFLNNFDINDNDLIIDQKMVFMITSFSKDHYVEYKACKDICTNLSLNLYRGDETIIYDEIYRHIIKYIIKANLIIVNIDDRNSNIIYELRIAQALGKRIILISKEKNYAEVNKYFIVYSDLPDLSNKMYLTLKELMISYKEHPCKTKNIDQSIYPKFNPNDTKSLFSLGLSYVNNKELEKALDIFNQLIEIDSLNINAILEIGKIYTYKNDYSSAANCYLHVIELDPYNEIALYELRKLKLKIMMDVL